MVVATPSAESARLNFDFNDSIPRFSSKVSDRLKGYFHFL